jgi:hypothetical protein
MSQTAEAAVSRQKFDREVGRLRASERMLTTRGIWVTEAEFPYVKIAFLATRMVPRVMALAVRVDFTDYDVKPFSVKFWDPFEDRELATSELQTLLRRRQTAPRVPGEQPVPGAEVVVNLVQSHGPALPAFLCLPGVREYHEHPAHTGDAWELHRRRDGGALFDLVETLWRYGSAPLTQLGVQMLVQLQQTEVPE